MSCFHLFQKNWLSFGISQWFNKNHARSMKFDENADDKINFEVFQVSDSSSVGWRTVELHAPIQWSPEFRTWWTKQDLYLFSIYLCFQSDTFCLFGMWFGFFPRLILHPVSSIEDRPFSSLQRLPFFPQDLCIRCSHATVESKQHPKKFQCRSVVFFLHPFLHHLTQVKHRRIILYRNC